MINHLQKFTHFGQSVAFNSWTTFTRYGYNFKAFIALWTDVLLILSYAESFLSDKERFDSKLTRTEEIFIGVRTHFWRKRFFVSVWPNWRNLWTNWFIVDLFGGITPAYLPLNLFWATLNDELQKECSLINAFCTLVNILKL